MENALINIDFENISEAQLLEIEEKAKEARKKSLDRRVAEIENWKKQQEVEFKITNNKVDILENENKT